MKTLRNLFSLFILSIGLLACEQEEVNFITPSVTQEYFEASGSMRNTRGYPIGDTNDIFSLNLQFNGEGQSNLLSNVILANSHTELYADEAKSIIIEEGKFLLKSASSDEELHGIYTGFGSKSKGHIEIYQTYQIRGGTGRFHSASGVLSVFSEQFAVDCNTRFVTMFGTINLQEDSL
jgi:hypothetical protein